MEDEQLTLDEAQLIMIAAYNSVCQIVGILGRRKLMTDEEVDALQQAMTEPLYHPDFASSELLSGLRGQAEGVLARALRNSARGTRKARGVN
jgi:hypothetical protein